MATQKSSEKDISFFVNEETPNYWKFMFFLIRNAFSTSKIILIAVIIVLLQVGSQIPQAIQGVYQAYSNNADKKLAETRADKLLTLKNFDADGTSNRISQIYSELEQIKNSTEEYIRKTNSRSGVKEEQLNELNSRYAILVSEINSKMTIPYKGITLAKNPTNINLDNFSKSEISEILQESMRIKGNFYHASRAYTDFIKRVNYSLTYK